jgi:hypothetical protein
MKFSEQLNRFLRLDQLIRLKATGTPKELAKKIGVSKSVLYDYINEMKEQEAPIVYDKRRKSFCYSENVKLEYGFKKLDKEQLENLKGGLSYSCSIFQSELFAKGKPDNF